MPCYNVSIYKSYRCDKAECICIPTVGKSCICLCEDDRGFVVKCDDCKCVNTDTCQCKCDDSKCTCIDTKGADCICVCQDGKGGFKICDCLCTEDTRKECKKEVAMKSSGCCTKKSEEEARGSNSKCNKRKSNQGTSEAERASKNYKCDMSGCTCIPTGGKSCICVCEDDGGDIIKCDDCKCVNSDTCQRKCDDSKCTCIDTKGADCICVCRDGKGGFKTCDCLCTEDTGKECKKEVAMKSSGCCTKKSEEKARGSNSKCDKKKGYSYQGTSKVEKTNKNYKCDMSGCICIPTGGKSCICVCEDDGGDIIKCDDCKCVNTDTCQRKCVDSKCTCIDTKGADCICVCRDGKGGFKTCDCPCIEDTGKECTKEMATKSSGCCTKKSEEEARGSNSKCDKKKGYQGTSKVERTNKNYKCDMSGCTCIPTGGKSCICVCENDGGDIIKCDDCKCVNSDTCQRKCDDSKCTCIDTKGADCICVCQDGKGGFKTCDCLCTEDTGKECKKEVAKKSSGCCTKNLEEEARGSNIKCNKKKSYQGTSEVERTNKNYKCDMSGCTCIPAGGKSCICVCEDDGGDIIKCDDCKCVNTDTCQRKCVDSKCTCIDTKGADCICVCRDGKGGLKSCDCSCSENKITECCKTEKVGNF